METKLYKTKGIIQFEPENVTNKHKAQAEWKRVAMIILDEDIILYYQWFLFKELGLRLNPKPIRPSHISFINDHYYRDTKLEISDIEKDKVWNKVKEKWDGKEIDIILNVDFHTNGDHIWQIVPHEYREELQSIRNELGLDRPFAGMHITIGRPLDNFKEQLQYINSLERKGYIELHESKYDKN